MKKIKPGSLVEYRAISGKKKVKVLKVKEDGKLILATKKTGLIKNVCVKSSRVKLIN